MNPPTDLDRSLLQRAIALADNCPPSRTAFAVGALIATSDGTILGEGWSRKSDLHEHAEEAALTAVPDQDLTLLPNATIYSSLEPCSTRSSRPVTCTQHILDAGIPKIVFAWAEPPLFVDCVGAEILAEAGREVIQIEDLADLARRPNLHLFKEP
jgi:diaminohydroxyphosphoribosylaminopyrimidine deaminase/5-amino-6-(5-phosphoribosylamino)uracil reductase